MRISRRHLLGGTAAAAAVAGLGLFRRGPAAAPILINHLGFVPDAEKRCMSADATPGRVEVVDAGGKGAWQGEWRVVSGDFGAIAVASLPHLPPGVYQVRAPGRRSARFSVHERIYDEAIGQCIGYFARQRCGDSETGYNAPCHLDDGVRRDNNARQDVVGGWHDACDVRKWVSATIFGMVGLSRVLEEWRPEASMRSRILDEMRWGNAYFLKMQEPDGCLMSYCGGDDGNHFTDNVAGTTDDRFIHVEPADLPEQFHFIAAQAALIRHTRASDPAYARRCDEAAQRCLEFCTRRRSARAAGSVAAALIACLEMNRATPGVALRKMASALARQLVALQVTRAQSPDVHGFFLASPDAPEPYRDIMHGNLPLLALTAACEQLEDDAEHPAWRQALRLHCDHLVQMASRWAFGIVPFGLYSGNDPGGGRRIGAYWYRWFMKRRGETSTADWWVGINAHLASNGVGLCAAARVLDDPRLRGLAQHQLDWIIGRNPFDASTMTGIGRNHPPLFVTGEFKPPTPLLPGGVMNGIGGSRNDEPDLFPGSYHTCEYWTPMVAYTMWLMSRLQAP